MCSRSSWRNVLRACLPVLLLTAGLTALPLHAADPPKPKKLPEIPELPKTIEPPKPNGSPKPTEPGEKLEQVTVTVHTDQTRGSLRPERVTNLSCDAIFAQTTSPYAETAFNWVRATNGLSYVRCYNWLGDGVPRNRPEWFSGCRVARKEANGDILYDWSNLERVLDTLVASGVKPMIVCGGLPDALLEPPIRRNEGGQAINRPRDYAQYQNLLTQMFRRLIKTYGAEEVRTWYFEVWSQPDHEGSWDGGRPAPFKGEVSAEAVKPFLRLYDHFVAAATSVDPALRIGGPGLAGDLSFFRRFLEHCARGTNSVTQQKGAPLKFISWQRYGTVSDIVRWNAELRGIVEKEFPELKDVQYILSECGSGSVEGLLSAMPYEAARMAALLDQNARAEKGVDLIFRSGDLTDDHFDGFRPLFTQLGNHLVPLPAFRLYTLLSKLGGMRLHAEAPENLGVIATRPTTPNGRNASQILLYHYDPSILPGTGRPRSVRLRVSGLPDNLLRLPMRLYHLNSETSSPYQLWLEAGKPVPAPDVIGSTLIGEDPLGPHEQSLGVFINGGVAEVEVRLEPNAVALVTFGSEPVYGAALSERGKRMRQAEDDFVTAADFQLAGDAERAIDALRKVAIRYKDTYWEQLALEAIVGVCENDLRDADRAETARRELLALPIDPFKRVRLLERLRIDLVRKNNLRAVEDVTNQIRTLEQYLREQRQWATQRFVGQ